MKFKGGNFKRVSHIVGGSVLTLLGPFITTPLSVIGLSLLLPAHRPSRLWLSWGRSKVKLLDSGVNLLGRVSNFKPIRNWKASENFRQMIVYTHPRAIEKYRYLKASFATAAELKALELASEIKHLGEDIAEKIKCSICLKDHFEDDCKGKDSTPGCKSNDHKPASDIKPPAPE